LHLWAITERQLDMVVGQGICAHAAHLQYCAMRFGFSSRECGSDTLYGDIAYHHRFLDLARVAMLIVDSKACIAADNVVT
jgi:hypothetical protein